MEEKTLENLKKLLTLIQKYCSLIIPNDDKCKDNYSIVKRSNCIILILAAVVFILIFRLFFLLFCDTYKHKIYIKKPLQFKRLPIVDRNGKNLVNSIEVYDFYLQPSKINDIKMNIQKINKVIPNAIKNETAMFEKLKSSKQIANKTVFIKKEITIQQRQELLDNGIEGMFFESKEKRSYTYSSTNSITGYCPSINNCVSGIEKSMNTFLTTPENKSLKLSINISVQNILREILKKRVEETSSQGAAGIIMNIQTGEIISAISLPDCDFNDYSSTCTASSLFNKYSYGIYELGSVMKLITVGLALQSGISPYKRYERKSYKIDDKFTIHDIDRKESGGGSLNLIEMTKKSSNVGFAKLMEDINIENQVAFMSNLGLLKKIKTELPELAQPQYPKKWTFVNAVTMSYGHGIAITPLHYVTAIASLLKNSIVQPTFLAVDNEHNNENQQNDENSYKYLNDNEHNSFKYIMREVISSGGGRSAYIDQYDIGGKTGTAIQLVNGKYNKYSMVLSFVAALPMDNPQYVFFLMLDRPRTDKTNNATNRASNLLGSTMGYVISTIGQILNIKPTENVTHTKINS